MRLSLRHFLPAVLIALPILAQGSETKIGLYMKGVRIGEAVYSTTTDTLDGKTVTRGDSRTLISTEMLGTGMKIEMTSTTWSDAGRPIRMTMRTSSAGRNQSVDALFGTTHADVTVEAGGAKQVKRLEIPTDHPIVDDPLPLVLAGGPNTARTFYVLRAETVSFVKNQLVLKGPADAVLGDRRVSATLVEVIDPMATLRIFVSSKGDLIKAEGPLGIEMIPDTEQVVFTSPDVRTPDLAEASAIRPDKPLANPRKMSRLVIQIGGAPAAKVPSDDHQSAWKEGDAWVLDIEPPRLALTPGVTIDEARRQMPQWTEPELYMPSDSETFVQLAKEIVGERKRVRDAALAVKQWTYRRMRPNAGIGVLRDATEVLQTREGVCRDAAILAGTILRASGIPTRLASGLVSWEGPFYYHAWVEVWDGKRWIGIDPSTPDEQISAAHVKLAGGTVEEAFRFPVLDSVTVKVVRAEGN